MTLHFLRACRVSSGVAVISYLFRVHVSKSAGRWDAQRSQKRKGLCGYELTTNLNILAVQPTLRIPRNLRLVPSEREIATLIPKSIALCTPKYLKRVVLLCQTWLILNVNCIATFSSLFSALIKSLRNLTTHHYEMSYPHYACMEAGILLSSLNLYQCIFYSLKGQQSVLSAVRGRRISVRRHIEYFTQSNIWGKSEVCCSVLYWQGDHWLKIYANWSVYDSI